MFLFQSVPASSLNGSDNFIRRVAGNLRDVFRGRGGHQPIYFLETNAQLRGDGIHNNDRKKSPHHFLMHPTF